MRTHLIISHEFLKEPMEVEAVDLMPKSASTAGYDYKLGGPVTAQFPIQLIHQVMEPSGLAEATWPAQEELPLAKAPQQ